MDVDERSGDNLGTLLRTCYVKCCMNLLWLSDAQKLFAVHL